MRGSFSSSSSDIGCPIIEQTTGIRRRRVSLSSTDSEPLHKHPRCGATVTDEVDVDSVDSGNDPSQANRGCALPLASLGVAAEAPEEVKELYDEGGAPLLRIPIERVSESSVATVTALITRCGAGRGSTEVNGSGSCEGIRGDGGGDAGVDNNSRVGNNSDTCAVVADNALGTFVMDAGTRVCLFDGTVVGVVTAVMGPVGSCIYGIVCHSAVLNPLVEGGRLAVGTELRYDLGAQRIIYDPSAQCDTTRGTDASYVNDEELPAHAKPDFSDDEEERRWRFERRAVKLDGVKGQGPLSLSDSSDDVSGRDGPDEMDWENLEKLEDHLLTRTEAPVVRTNDSTHIKAKEEPSSGALPIAPGYEVPDLAKEAPAFRVVVPPWLMK
uniref:Uncharacterized protein n=1 Tax=Trypanosoma congolense (strain IL3000) TaxID=1068625 RepID=G0UJB9_TRYCI|nr:conserved hypothetical protein [Trypanosoma congolense IL3000]